MKKLKRKIAFILILVTFLIFVPISVIETVSSEYASKVKIALGQKAFEQKEYRKAIAHYLEAYKLLLDTTAVEMKEEKVSVRWRLAVNYGIIGEDDKAVQFCDEAHNLASKKEWNDYLFGRYAPTLIYSYYKVGKYEQAIEFYNKILKQNRTDRYSLYVRGLCYRAIGDHSNAFFDIEKAESTGFRKSQLEAYREVNEVIPEKDVKKVEHDLDPDPEKDDRVKESEQKTVENEAYISYYNKGTELNFKEKYNEALVEFRRALELEKNDSHVWNNVGVAFSGLNKRDDAIRCFEKAV
jgi:tetratricopeptide (TPR) repeat protein